MFGRILSIEVFDKYGDSAFLVDPDQETKLQCSGTIEYLPSSSGSPRATIQVYNIPATIAAPIFALKKTMVDESTGEDVLVDDPKFIRISFGYQDENDGKTSVIFVGTIARAFTTRQDATTTITKIYAYQIQNFFTSAVSTAQFDTGTSVYDVVEGLFENSTVQGMDYQIPEALKEHYIDSPISFYGKTLDCVNSILSKVEYMISTTPMGIVFVPMRPTSADLDVVILGEYTEDGKVVARSGLIGYPCIDTEGMRFETLINPKIVLYSYVWLPNSVIIDNRDGFVPSNQFGASYDPAGLYRVVKMTTQFDSHVGACKTSYVAVMAGTSSAYYK